MERRQAFLPTWEHEIEFIVVVEPTHLYARVYCGSHHEVTRPQSGCERRALSIRFKARCTVGHVGQGTTSGRACLGLCWSVVIPEGVHNTEL